MSQHKQAMTGPEPEDVAVFQIDIDSSPMLDVGTKRQAKSDNSDAKKSKKDRKKDLPSLFGTKNPTHARNLFAQTIQESLSAKAAALATIEEKKLKFEQLKWDTERAERVVRRREEREEYEQKRNEDGQRRKEDMEEERKRRAEDKVEKCRERRFALLQTMLADGKSTDEIKEILGMLL